MLIIILINRLNINSNLLSVVCFLVVVINVIVFAINQVMIRKELENAELRKQLDKENIDYEEYMLLKEKHEQTKIFHHDFKEHMNTLNALIGESNEKAKAYIKSITQEEGALRLTEYTDNKILNILLTKKKAECAEQGISFSIDPVRAHLDFISDMDTVTIFSNLINNASESCLKSKEKKIFLSIGAVNDNFVVIKLENTADTKPVVINGVLRTHKNTEKLHGIGMNSIRRALKGYEGALDWEYDTSEKMFRTRIVIKNDVKK